MRPSCWWSHPSHFLRLNLSQMVYDCHELSPATTRVQSSLERLRRALPGLRCVILWAVALCRLSRLHHVFDFCYFVCYFRTFSKLRLRLLFSLDRHDHLIWFTTIQSVGTSSWLTTFVSPRFALHGHGGMLEQKIALWKLRTAKCRDVLILAEGLWIQIVWSRGNTNGCQQHSFDNVKQEKQKFAGQWSLFLIETIYIHTYTVPVI